MRALSSIPFCPCDCRRVGLGYLSAAARYTTNLWLSIAKKRGLPRRPPVTPCGIRSQRIRQRRGVSAYQLQQWLGHANLNTTQIYVHLGKQNARKIMQDTNL